MTSVFFDTNALYIEGYRDSFVAGSLTFDLIGNKVGVRVLHGTDYLVEDDWSVYTRQDGSAFASIDDLTAYLTAQFAMRRPVGGIVTLTAGENLSGHQALMFALDGSGSAIRADLTAENYAFAGISLGAASVGSSVQALTAGLAIEPSWSWAPLNPVYVGMAGSLTQVVPASGLFHLIGFASSATSLLVSPGPLVQLA